MPKKNITTDNLAIMVAKGFEDTKKDIGNLKSGMDKRFDKVESRLDRVEALLTTDYKRRVEKLELETCPVTP